MDYTKYAIGDKVCEPSRDMTQFDMTDSGGILLVKMRDPTAKEKKAFKDGIMFRFVVVDDIIMILFRMGMNQWMDAPYNRHLSRDLTSTEFPEDGEGLAIHAMLIDAATGKLVNQKIFSPDTATSRALVTAIQCQPEIPDYDLRLARVYQRYTTQALVDMWERGNA